MSCLTNSRFPFTPILTGLLAPFVLAFTWMLVRFWGLQTDYADRFLILVGAGWVAHREWPRLLSIPASPSVLGVPFVWLGALAFPVGIFLFMQVGPRIVTLWWGHLSLTSIAVGLLVCTHGWARVRPMLFPICFTMLTPPLIGRINDPLQNFLQNCTTTLAHNGFTAMGIEAIRNGFVLRLPGGDLGVIEACSGVRSVTALTSIAIFLAYTRNLGFLRGFAALLLSIPIIILVNALRVFVSGLLQEGFSQAAIQGWKHEVLGFSAVFIGLAIVAGITSLLKPNRTPPALGPPAPAHTVPRYLIGACALGLLAGIVLTVAAFSSKSLVNSADAEAVPLSTIPTTISVVHLGAEEPTLWRMAPELPIPEGMYETLNYQDVIYRTYRNPVGDEVTLWAFRWTSAGSVKDYHHPDICMPNAGHKIEARKTEPLHSPGGRVIQSTYREFSKDRDRKVIVYWTQEGRRIWTDDDEVAAYSFTYPFKWVKERMKPRQPGDVDDRLVILCGAQDWVKTPAGQKRMLEFIAAFADELYQLQPWADPKQP